MTTDEMFQLILNKFTSFENELKELRSDVNIIKAKQDKLEEIVVANHKYTLDLVLNLRLDLMTTNDKIDKLHAEFRSNRRNMETSISDLQLRQDYQEYEIDKLKKKAS